MTNDAHPCPAAWDRSTPCVDTTGDGHDGPCLDGRGRTWSRSDSWFTPETRQAAEEGLEWL